MDNIEAIIVRADLTGNLSEGAQAAVQDLARLEAAASKAQRSTADIGEGAQRASAGFSALEARLDSNVRLTNAKAAADARLAREIETITRATEANAAAQVRANALIEAATRNRDAYIARVRQDITATEQRTARVLGETGAITQFGAANDNAAQSSGRMRMALGQAGFQVQDFATQVSMGQNALMAFGVQGAQLAGVFGPAGAIAGAALMIGVIGAQLIFGKNAADQFTDSINRQATAFQAVEDDAKRYREGLEVEGRQVRELTQYYGTLSDARQSQEMRQFRRDQVDLEATQGRLRNDALGSTSGLSQAFQTQLSEVQTAAARDYGRGSTEYGLIISNPDLQRMREFVAVVEGFRETGDVSREALARLYQQMIGLADGSDAVSRRVLAQAAAIDGLVGRARDAETAQTQLAARASALGLNLDGAATATARLNRQLADLARYDANVGKELDQEISDLTRQIAAASVGAGRLRQVQDDIARDNRLERLVTARASELERLGITGEAAASSLATFRTETGRTLGQITVLSGGLRTLEDGFRNTAPPAQELADGLRAVQDAQKDYDRFMQEGVTITQSVRTEAEKYAEQLSVLNALLSQGAITQETYNRAVNAADPAIQAARRVSEESARSSQSAANTIESNFSGAFTRAFEAGANAGQSFLTSIKNGVKSLAATIASQLVFRMAVVPVVNAGAGALGYAGNFLGTPNSAIGGLNIGGVLGGPAGVSAAGSVQAGVSQAGQSGALMSAGRYGNLGQAFTGQGLANTGFGLVDGALNTQLVAPSTLTQTGFVGAGGVPIVDGSAGLTVAGGIGGAAGVLGGAYGIYSGIQKGGVGGAVGVAGGAAGVVGGGLSLASGLGMIGPGLAALGPYALIAAAVLAVVSAMLPGEKASGRAQSTYVNVDDGSVGYAGLGGKRFSQENREQSQGAAEQIANLAREVGKQLGGAQFGSHVAVGVGSSRGDGAGKLYLDVAGRKGEFSNDEAGSKAMAETAARYVIQQFRDEGRASGDYASILNNSGDDIKTLSENLDWYEKIYKTMDGTTPKIAAFDQALTALRDSFQPNIDKANALGLSVEKMTEAREKELVKLEATRWERAGLFDQSLEQREMRLRGDSLGADLMTFDQQAKEQLASVKTALEDLGLTGEEFSKRYTRNEQVLADERLAIQKQYADQAAALAEQTAATASTAAKEAAAAQVTSAKSVLDWLNGQALGTLSSLSPTARMSEAERQFNTALQAGDTGAITGAADALLSSSREVLGGATSGYAQREAFVRATVGQVGLRAAQAGGNADVVAALSQTVVALSAKLDELKTAINTMAADARTSNTMSLAA